MVHGNHTTSGKPLLMADPHLKNGIPSLWSINKIDIKDNFAFGAAAPGLPGIYIGRTK